MTNLIKNIDTLEKKYLLEDLTKEDLEFLKDNNIKCYQAGISTDEKYDVEKYIFTNQQELVKELSSIFSAEELVDSSKASQETFYGTSYYTNTYTEESIKEATVEDVADYFIIEFDIDNQIDLLSYNDDSFSR